MDAEPSRLLLVRHGQIEANTLRLWHGSTDSPLTEQGRGEAGRVATFLADNERPAAVYASPLERAHHTARAIGEALSLSPSLEPGLAEWGIGELEGVSYDALMSEHDFFSQIRDPDYAPRGGESVRRVSERVLGAWERLREQHVGAPIVLVGHGAATAIGLAALIDGSPLEWQRYHVANCSVSELRFDPTPQLVSFNFTEHL